MGGVAPCLWTCDETAIVTRAFLILALAFLTGLRPACAAPAPPPPVVTVAIVQRENVAPSHRFIGHVVAIQSVKIVPRVTAFIEQAPVQQGSEVKAGEVLFELQRTQYEAALQSAQAQVASAQAALKNDQVALERAQKLNTQGFEAKANLDTATAARDQAQASVQSAQAAVTLAQLNLSYCTIRSPIDGRIGAITLTKGNLVTPSTPALATVAEINPIRVVFSVATTDLKKELQQTGWALPKAGKGLEVNLRLPDGSAYPETGRVEFFGNEVDEQTGTVPAYADFANPQALLLPGEYVSVTVRRATPQEKLLAPVAAVQTDQQGSFVLTVGADGKVAQQPVTIGPQIAESFIVTKGLTAGERVIVVGVQKVHPGELVKPIEAPAAEASAAKQPPGQSD